MTRPAERPAPDTPFYSGRFGASLDRRGSRALRGRSDEVFDGPQFTLLDYFLACATGILTLLLYLRTLAPGLLFGDSGEFQFAAWLGGFAHPTGYPLYLLLGHLWSRLAVLEVGGPAWRMNAFSALWGGVAVGLTYLLAYRVAQISFQSLNGSLLLRIAGIFAAWVFATNATFWSQAVIAEVYTLNATLTALFLLCLVIWSSQPEGRRSYHPLYWAALVFGLGLAHHRSIVLALPGAALYLWQCRLSHERWRIRLGGLLWAMLLILLPLLFYLYIPLRAPSAPYATLAFLPGQPLLLYQPTASWFAGHVTGRTFEVALRPLGGAINQLPVAAGRLLSEFSWAGIAFGGIGIARLAARREGTGPLLSLTGTTFALVVLFNLFYGIGDIAVFYIPAYLIWALWAAVGLVVVVTTLSRGARSLDVAATEGSPKQQRRTALISAVIGAIVVFLLPGWQLVHGYADRDQSSNQAARAFWERILAEPLPKDAILVSNDRDEMVPLWYLQYVEGIRTDLLGLFPLIQPGPEWSDVGQVVDTARRAGRPVILVKPMPGLEIKFRTEPIGSVLSVTGPAVSKSPARPRDIDFSDLVRLNGYDVEPPFVTNSGTETVTLYWQSARSLGQVPSDLTSFVHIINADGSVVGQSDHRPGGVFYPSSLWRPGEMIKDIHTIKLSPDIGQSPYSIEVGLYILSPEMQHLGSPQRVGQLSKWRPSDPVPPLGELVQQGGFTFGNEIVLRAYEVMPANGDLRVGLYWQALDSPAADYTVFLHLLDGAGNIVAQSDRQPAGGDVPTSTWPPRHVLADEMILSVPPNLPPGTYRLIAGLYHEPTLHRLAATDEKGQPVGDAVELSELKWPLAR